MNNISTFIETYVKSWVYVVKLEVQWYHHLPLQLFLIRSNIGEFLCLSIPCIYYHCWKLCYILADHRFYNIPNSIIIWIIKELRIKWPVFLSDKSFVRQSIFLLRKDFFSDFTNLVLTQNFQIYLIYE